VVFTITMRYQHLVVGDVVVGAGPVKETQDTSLRPVALYAGTDGFYVSGAATGLIIRCHWVGLIEAGWLLR
jgi:hypothetical protein